MVTHGVSRGDEVIKKTSRGAAKERGQSIFFRPFRGLAICKSIPTAHAVG